MRASWVIGGITAAALGCSSLAVVPMMMLTTMGTGSTGSSQAATCAEQVPQAGNATTLKDPAQKANAKAIIETGLKLKVPDRGLVVAIATALQESGLRNLTWGDRDSVGLFQQRNAWAPYRERTNPAAAATMFYTGGHAGQRGLLDIAGWQSMSMGRAAQAVQVSAFPLAYAKWEKLATATVREVTGGKVAAPKCTPKPAEVVSTGPGSAMVEVAKRQMGKSYIFGAVGPNHFDCSGLVIYSWGQVGYKVRVRTAAMMWNNSTPIPWDQARTGDLVFGEWNGRVRGAGHVMIVVKPGQAVQAPSTGDVVKLTDLKGFAARGWKIGRLKPSVLTKN